MVLRSITVMCSDQDDCSRDDEDGGQFDLRDQAVGRAS